MAQRSDAIPEIDVAPLFDAAGSTPKPDRPICEAAREVGFVTIVGMPEAEARSPAPGRAPYEDPFGSA